MSESLGIQWNGGMAFLKASKSPGVAGYIGHKMRWLHMFLLAFHDGPVIGQLEVYVLGHCLSDVRCTNVAPGNQRPCPQGVLSYLYVCMGDGTALE